MSHNSQTFQPLLMVFLQAVGQYDIPLLLALKKNSWMDFSYDCEFKKNPHNYVLYIIYIFTWIHILISWSNFEQLMLLYALWSLNLKVCLPEKVVIYHKHREMSWIELRLANEHKAMQLLWKIRRLMDWKHSGSVFNSKSPCFYLIFICIWMFEMSWWTT